MTSPYREGKAVDVTIAPDRRRQKMLVTLAAGAFLGIIGIEVTRIWLADTKKPVTVTPLPSVTFTPAPGRITNDEVTKVVDKNSPALRTKCFAKTTLPGAQVTVDVVIGPYGEVASISSSGTDRAVTSCVETEVRGWIFYAHEEASMPVRIPFKFERS